MSLSEAVSSRFCRVSGVPGYPDGHPGYLASAAGRGLDLPSSREPLDAEHGLQLVRIAIDRFVEQGLSEPEWEVPDEVLTQFPDDIRSYFRPRPAGDGPEKLDHTGGETA